MIEHRMRIGTMNTYLVTWNPDNWPWKTLAHDALQTANGNSVSGRWSCGNTKKIEEGDRLFLLKQGPKSPRGLFASGRATSGVYHDKHWRQASAGKKARYVHADWDTILNINTESLLQVSEIDEGHAPQVNWKTQSSGIAIPLPVARRISSPVLENHSRHHEGQEADQEANRNHGHQNRQSSLWMGHSVVGWEQGER
jgi:hypothetical protein